MKNIKTLLISALVLGTLTGCGSGTVAKYETLLTLDVNPNVQLQLDDDNKVIAAIYGNEDGKKVLADMDLENAGADVAINAVLGSLVKNGYLSADNNTVLLSVENDDDEKRMKLEEDYSQFIQSSLKTYSIDGAIFSQDLDIDDDIEELMAKYDISYGKASLIEKILDENDDNNNRYKIEELTKLNAQELVLIHQAAKKNDKDDDNKDKSRFIGTVSTSKYISRDKALSIVLADAGLKQSQIKDLEIDFDSENGVLTYEIEFKSGNKEYEYEVSATKGIIEREVDVDNKTSTNKPTTNTGASDYGDTDYGPNNDGVTDYNDSNYGSSGSNGSSNYDDGNSNYDNGNSNYDSGNSNYDDGNSNYDSGNSNYDSGDSSYDNDSGYDD